MIWGVSKIMTFQTGSPVINNNGATAPGSEPQPMHLMTSQHPEVIVKAKLKYNGCAVLGLILKDDLSDE